MAVKKRVNGSEARVVALLENPSRHRVNQLAVHTQKADGEIPIVVDPTEEEMAVLAYLLYNQHVGTQIVHVLGAVCTDDLQALILDWKLPRNPEAHDGLQAAYDAHVQGGFSSRYRRPFLLVSYEGERPAPMTVHNVVDAAVENSDYTRINLSPLRATFAFRT